MGRLEAWARAHKGAVAVLAAIAAAIPVLFIMLHPKSRSAAASAAQGAISYIPAQFTPQPQAGGVTSSSGSSTLSQIFQGDFSSIFGQTHISQSGSHVQATDVPGGLGSEFGGVFAGGLVPTSVYQFLLDMYQQLGLGAPPTSGTFTFMGPNGQLQTTPFWAPGSGPPAQSIGVNGAPVQGPPINLKTQLSNVPQSSRVMQGVG